jgi:hypothetical protein
LIEGGIPKFIHVKPQKPMNNPIEIISIDCKMQGFDVRNGNIIWRPK